MSERKYGRTITLEEDLRSHVGDALDEEGHTYVDRMVKDHLKTHYDTIELDEAINGEDLPDGKVIVDKENREAAYIASEHFDSRNNGYMLDFQDYGKLDDVVMDLQSRYGGSNEVKQFEGLWEK